MDDTSLQFAQPLWILAGLVVCGGAFGLFILFDRRREAALAQLIHPRFRQRLTEGFSPWRRNLKRVLWLLAVFLLFVAIARPQMGYEWHEVKRKGIDILFAVDTSRSMLAEDLTPNRLERARLGIVDFVGRLESDRVGLIPFAGSAFALCPLTLDYDSFRESLDALDTDLIPRQGTDLASAIKEAERLFDEVGNNQRVLVLLTDGEDLQGSVIDAAKNAAKKGMTIYTVGVGSPDGATMPIRYQNGRTDFVRDSSGQVVKTQLDEETLKKIAEETRGLYVPLGRGAEGLDTIYQERLSLVPKSELDQRMERVALERFEWPLALGLGLLIFEFFMGERRQAKPVRELPSAARRVNPLPRVVSLALMGLLIFSQVAETRAADAKTGVDSQQSYNKGTDAYGKGDFTAAADALRISLRTPDLALQQRAYYNLGNSLYRAGQGSLEKDPDATVRSWEAAVKAYDDVLALNAGDSDALFNKELVARKLDELKKQQEQDKKQDPSKDEDKKDEDKKDGDKKDGDKKGEDKKDGEKKGEDEKESKDGEESKDGKEDGSEGKDEKEGKDSGKDGDSKDAKDSKDGKEGEKREPGEEAKDSEAGKDEGDKQAGEQEAGEKDAEGKDAGAIEEARAQKQEMTPEEAKQLLDSLRSDERMVVPIPQPQRGRYTTDQTIKGKTW
jgi:Ca-activated chloride channel family protein